MILAEERWRKIRYGLLALAFAFASVMAIAPTKAMAEPVTLTEDYCELFSSYITGDGEADRWVGNRSDRFDFRLTNPSDVYIDLSANPYDYITGADVECRVFDQNSKFLDGLSYNSADKSARTYMYIALPKGDYYIELSQKAPSSVETYMRLSARATVFYAGEDYQVVSPLNSSLESAVKIPLDKTIAGKFNNYYGNATNGEINAKRYFSFDLKEATNVKFMTTPYYGEQQLSLIDSSGNVIKSAKSPYNTGQDYYDRFSLDCGRLNAGTHYICLETLDTPGNHLKSLNERYLLEVKTGHEMYRMYNKWNTEHMYTASPQERDAMVKNGWDYEGVMWYAPVKSDYPVYRLYNPYTNDHHYTRDLHEYNVLPNSGWQQEGLAFYSMKIIDHEGYTEHYGMAVLRLFNPYKTGAGTHHYTMNSDEFGANLDAGWRYEGDGWAALIWSDWPEEIQ